MLPILFCCFLATQSSFAQVIPDSLLQKTEVGKEVLHQRDTLQIRKEQAENRLDSLRQKADSLVYQNRVVTTVTEQKDSLAQAVRQKQEQLLHPVDSIMGQARQKLSRWQDSLANRLPLPEAVQYKLPALPDVLPTNKLRKLVSPSEVLTLNKLTIPQVSPERIAARSFQLPKPASVAKFTAEWQEKVAEYGEKLSEHTSKLSQFTSANAETLEQQLLQQLPEGQTLVQQQQAMQGWQQSMQQEEQWTQIQEQLVAQSQDYFAGHTETLQTAKEQLVKLKQTYSQVQTDQDILVKKSSLEGKPFGDRLTYGGTLQVLTQPTVSLDLSPLLGYRWNKRFTTGLGATYRLTLSEDIRSIQTAHPIYGGRVFVEYSVLKSFLLHAEYEGLSQVEDPQSEFVSRQWYYSFLAGIGKTYRITSHLQGQVLLLYNFSHGTDSPYPRPFVIRMAFRRVK
ncbi:MAG: hypothetical protein AAF223_07240 [Bacteroidota bacterium]